MAERSVCYEWWREKATHSLEVTIKTIEGESEQAKRARAAAAMLEKYPNELANLPPELRERFLRGEEVEG